MKLKREYEYTCKDKHYNTCDAPTEFRTANNKAIKLKKLGKLDEDIVVGNFVATIKPYVKEVVHRYGPANSKMTLDEPKILLINEEGLEREFKKRTGGETAMGYINSSSEE